MSCLIWVSGFNSKLPFQKKPFNHFFFPFLKIKLHGRGLSFYVFFFISPSASKQLVYTREREGVAGFCFELHFPFSVPLSIQGHMLLTLKACYLLQVKRVSLKWTLCIWCVWDYCLSCSILLLQSSTPTQTSLIRKLKDKLDSG